MTNDSSRLIEHAFPLKQTSIDSVHEKNVRHGHISTLHIWPARRPLAACRAALIATLLPDPGTPEKRRELCEKIGGKVVKRIERKKMPNGQIVEREKEETEGGILHWGRETENAVTVDWFREEIRKAYGGRAPRVLDPFAGGGAIPLEAMRLGCEATAIDINPVAWFILKCTLEYPQKLAGQKRPLPEFILKDREFMESFFKAQGLKGRTLADTLAKLEPLAERQGAGEDPFAAMVAEADTANRYAVGDLCRLLQADIAWHVRAWGQWVLDHARRDLAKYYPTYADFEPLKKEYAPPYEPQPMRLVPLREDGNPDIESLNRDFSDGYLEDRLNPRWVAKPTVAYLWARTVTCKNCRATVPLLKTRWLCKKERKRVVLTVSPASNNEGVVFGIQKGVPVQGGNAAQRREHDKRVGAGTMSRAGATCPCCGTIMTPEDLRVEGQSRRMGTANTAVVVDGSAGKEYRLPTAHEIECTVSANAGLDHVFADIPFGLPEEPTPQGASRKGGGSPFTVHLYGLDRWRMIFTARQLATLGTLVGWTRECRGAVATKGPHGQAMGEAVTAYLALAVDRVANRASCQCIWNMPAEKIEQTFARFALPVLWDCAESNPLANASGSYGGEVEWVALACEHLLKAGSRGTGVECGHTSAISVHGNTQVDLVVTDPPYYDAIPYSDLMDFFYVWLRRTLRGLSPEHDGVFHEPLAPKWDHAANDGELIDDASRHGGDAGASKRAYEDGMARAFQACHTALAQSGRLVIVFAHKQPDAWETLVSAIIRAGFVVDASWPIQTERSGRMRATGSAALASSVWLVCRKRDESAKAGWDNRVLEEMRANIATCLREFWDAGIRGPDFVWAATGPALEAYSQHPVVKKANNPNQIMEVHEFLTRVRRMVVDFVVGRVLSGDGAESDMAAADRLDEVTAYYLLHRHDFRMDEAPVGACILYAVSCGLSDAELCNTWDVLARIGGNQSAEDEDDEESEDDGEAEPEADTGGGSKVRLKTWAQRKAKSMGYEAAGGRAVPLIDRVHRLMHLWKEGDLAKVDEYLDDNALRRHELFKRLLQSLIELSAAGSEERALLESLSNHLGAKGARDDRQQRLGL